MSLKDFAYEAYEEAARKLGFDNGSNAVNTIGSAIVKEIKGQPSPAPVPIVSAPMIQIPEGIKAIPQDKLILAAAAVLVAVLIFRK